MKKRSDLVLLLLCALLPAAPAACEGKQEPADAAPDAPDDGAQDGLEDAAPEPLPDEADAGDAPETLTDPELPPGICFPNNDSIITRDELSFEIGNSAIYAVNAPSTTADVNVAGYYDGGVLRWDFTAPVTDDRRIIDELLSVSGRWFESYFPGAGYATVLDAAEGIMAVYAVTEGSLLLMGMASEEEGKTRLVYDPPVEIIRFPIVLDDTWQVDSGVSGLYNWLPTVAQASCTVRVDAAGVAAVPAGEFSVMRIRVDLSQDIPFTIFGVNNITYSFVAECYGVVAKIRSTDDEENPNFTSAAEYRRLTL